ncbi:phage tail assembly chaperone [Pseudomonas fontis]|uniref:Phage tail assembly chaperone n=1 Tax=Pseudomonas fontis TaxID=2942633 RepID=A0ABT5NPJ6_9PSED|nr:phage tail assembly chaperone [Pseudomonas fontis]MDD0972447.1 phage tail assembly chaperone [Pseudomonas fontis]MDD0990096.1 phage tail assembly chaperone [Pseudomonas fontis]
MKRYYSKSTGCCYLEGIHDEMPLDVKIIDEARYERVIANPPANKARGHDEEGLPTLVEPLPLSQQVLAQLARRWRDEELGRYLWLRERHRDEQELGGRTTLTESQYAQLIELLQKLRQWPQSENFPVETSRPSSPAWLVLASVIEPPTPERQ